MENPFLRPKPRFRLLSNKYKHSRIIFRHLSSEFLYKCLIFLKILIKLFTAGNYRLIVFFSGAITLKFYETFFTKFELEKTLSLWKVLLYNFFVSAF